MPAFLALTPDPTTWPDVALAIVGFTAALLALRIVYRGGTSK